MKAAEPVGFDELLARIRDIRASELRFYQKVRDGFLLLAREEPGRFRLVRGDGPVDTVQREIRDHVLQVLQERRVVA